MSLKALIVSFLLLNTAIYAQKPSQILIQTEYKQVIVGQDNRIEIVTQQCKPIGKNDVTATFQVYDKKTEPLEVKENNGRFTIKPPAIGEIILYITTDSGIVTKILMSHYMTAVGYFGGRRANSHQKIGAGEMKAQEGVDARVECCGYDAKCKVIDFELLRISTNGKSFKNMNMNGQFDEKSQKIIQQTQKSDIYVVRNIRYRCPGMPAPEFLEDMTFEIE
jgi:GldM C-terminal domain